ncbi:MAG: hypothetical protein WC869_09610 [Phycisphaerae bacterium]
MTIPRQTRLSEKRVATRLWWQRLLRAATLAGLVFCAAYVSIPWWAPTDFIRRTMAADMSRQLGVEVTIKRLSLSWDKGIVIEALTIPSPDGFSGPAMVEVGRIGADFSPLTLLVAGKLERVEIDGPLLQVQIRDNGQSNIAAVARMQKTFQLDQVIVRGGRVIVRGGAAEDCLELPIISVDMRSGSNGQLSQMTLSAGLKQKGAAAPISFRLSAPAGASVAALATMNFSNVDLAQLPLIEGLKLPLKKLSGVSYGSAEVEIDRNGMVSQFRGNINARSLDVQPAEGPALPVLENAGLGLTGSFDPIAGHVQVHQLELRLPGVELAGKAEMTADIYEGRWEAMRTMDLSGQLHPTTLAALLTGRGTLPVGLELTGPVGIHLTSQSDGLRADWELTAQARETVLSQNGRALKPAGAACQMEIKGSLNRRDGQLAVDQSEWIWGENRFSGSGTAGDIEETVAAAQGAEFGSVGRVLLAQLARLDWKGAWEIREMESLKGLLPPDSPLQQATIRGPITGRWFIDRSQSARFHLRADASGASGLTVGELFAQPSDAAISLDLDATIGTDSPGLAGLDVELTVGQGRLSMDNAELKADLSGAVPSVSLTGKYELDDLAALAQAFPCANDAAAGISGGLSGQIEVQADPACQQAYVTADLTATELKLRAFEKAAGVAAAFNATLVHNAQATRDRRNWLALEANLPWASARVEASAPDKAEANDAPVNVRVSACVTEAEGLAQALPVLRDNLTPGQLTGWATIDASVRKQGQEMQTQLFFDATGIELDSGGTVQRAKLADAPLVIEASGTLVAPEGGPIAISRIESFSAQLGRSHVAITCAVGQAASASKPASASTSSSSPSTALARTPTATSMAASTSAPTSGPAWDARRYKVDLAGEGVLDESLRLAFPELARAANQCGLEGEVSLSARLDDGPMGPSLKARLVGEKLGAAGIPLGLTITGDDGMREDLRVAKPVGMPCEASLEATFSPTSKGVLVNNVVVRAGRLQLAADGAITLESIFPPRAALQKAHLSLSTPKADELGVLLPALQSRRLGGSGIVEGDWDAVTGRMTNVSLCFGHLRGHYNNKDFALDGRLAATGVEWAAGDWKVQSVQTDGLEFQAGTNHGWLLAHLRNLPQAPVGEFRLLATRLDDKDLAEWLGGGAPTPLAATESPAKPGATSAPSTRPADAPPPLMTDAQRHDLAARAQELFTRAKPALLAAEVDGHVNILEFRTYDATVDRSYQVRNFNLTFLASDGQVEVDYGVAVNGGVITANYQADLTQDPLVAVIDNETRGVLADQNIQPQLAKFFPGNTVFGTFDRAGTASLPVPDLLAAVMDANYAMYLDGTAKTVATDGLLEGHAVPAFVTRIFPGLNLTRYRYNRMTSFAKFLPDGTAENDMVFSGTTYDIYIEGTTDRHSVGRYEVGLILVGTPQSAEWNHTYRQGRIPLLKFKARIIGGKMYDEVVSFVYPNEVLFKVFLKNNIFYRLWLASRPHP